MDDILELLQGDARLTAEEIAVMLKKDVKDVKKKILQMEKDGIILKYAAVVNDQKVAKTKELVQAFIEIQVTPERERGFDALAERIYKFPQVKSLYLMSGSYDLHVVIEGKTLKDVAFFVSEKLATLNGVKSTKTTFVLKKYKTNGLILVEGKEDQRQGVVA
jgi:DNA-binding Lrp family transcriptional regulator